MSFFGFIIRWGSMGVGLAVIAGSINASLSFQPRSERAASMTPDEALALADARNDAYVSIDAPLDPDSRVFGSCLNRPAFTPTDTNEVYTIDLDEGDPSDDLIGATVVAGHDLMEARIDCQVIVERGSDKQVQSFRILSPFWNTGARVWALSPRFYSQDEGTRWQNRGTYRGALSRFDDIHANCTDLGHDAGEIRAYTRSEFDVTIPGDAVVLLDGTGRTPGDSPAISYACVEGTGGALIVQSAGRELPTGPVSGMIDPRGRHAWLSDLATMMGASRPGRAVVIDTTRSAATENARDRIAMQGGLVAGVVLFAFGAVTTAIKIVVRSSRKRAAQDALSRAMGGLSPRQAMSLGIPTAGAPAPHRLTPYPPHSPYGPAAHPLPGGMASPGWASGPVPARAAGAMGSKAATSDEDAALEAEMARWTSGNQGNQAA